MKKDPWVPIGFFALIIFSGCGPQLDVPTVSSDLLQKEQVLQKEMLFKTVMERHIRLNRVYTRIATTGAELCGKQVKPVLGLVILDRGSLRHGFKEWAIRIYNINEGVKIIDIVPGSPAAEEGLQPGDVILDMAQGANVVPTSWGWSTFTLKDFGRIVSRAGKDTLSLLVRRKGKIFVTRITPKLACNYNAQVAIADSINAMAYGERIVVTTGTLNFTRNDDELAIIVGHEVAHNALKHIDRQKANIMIGSLLGAIFDIGLAAGAGVNTGGAGSDLGSQVGSFAYSQEFEIEADYMGLYLASRAGFDISNAPDLFRRMGVEHPGSIRKNYLATHPSTPERVAVMQKTLQEIRAKVRMGKSLVPTKLEATSEEKMAHKDKDPEPVGDRVKLESQPAETQVLEESASMGKKHHEPKKKPVEQQAVLQEDAVTVKRHGTLELTGGPLGSAGMSLEAEFLDSGKGQGQTRVIYPNMYMLDGQYWTIGAGQIFQGLVNPTLMNPDSLKGYSKNDLKGFAAYSGSDGTTMECVYVILATSEISEGTCIDTQKNQYRLAFSGLSATAITSAIKSSETVHLPNRAKDKKETISTTRRKKVSSSDRETIKSESVGEVAKSESGKHSKIVKSPKRADKIYSLIVHATPSGSTIKIMNIGAKYKDGIKLKPGKYDVLVTKPGYVSTRQWITLATSDKIVKIVLNKSESAALSPPTTAVTTTLTPMAVHPEGTVSPRDIDGWRNTRWEMTEAEVEAALPGEVVRVKTRIKDGSTKALLQIKDFELIRHRFTVSLGFGSVTRRLDAVLLNLKEDNHLIAESVFHNLEQALTEKYGSATYRNEDREGGALGLLIKNVATWRLNKTKIDLKYLYVEAGNGVFLTLHYKPLSAQKSLDEKL